MKKMLTAMLAAAVAGALFIAAPLVAAPPGTENYNKSGVVVYDCEGGSLTFTAPSDLWPPNHKYYEDISVLATSDDPEEELVLTTTGTHDQYDADTGVEQNGAGNTADDITVDDDEAAVIQENSDSSDPQIVAVENGTGTVLTDWQARAERSGRDQTGRVYTLSGDTEFSGQPCSFEVTMTVPHDMRPSNR